MQIRDATPRDFDTILALNEAEVTHTSAMDRERIGHLNELACYHRVAVEGEKLAGFLLAMDETAPYKNDNHGWFAARYRSFVYVDRIVVAAEFAGRKVGSALYADLFDFAQARQAAAVVCEYNLDPPNLPSEAFHRKWGFRQVGTQRVADDTKLVSMQAAELAAS
jgi:predicted GNAT superfamily acetyltransferase